MIIEITDSTTPMLSVIAQASREVAFEQMSKIGNTLRVNSGKRMRSVRHHWFQRASSKGKRVPYKDASRTKELGQRTDINGVEISPDSMANMISSNLMEESGLLVVGGRNKRKRIVIRRNGAIVGSGTMNAITKHSQSIINKLDTGRRNEYHGWGKSGFEKNSMRNFRNVNYRANNFMMRGYYDSVGYMQSSLTGEYERIVGLSVNRVSVNLKPSTRNIG